MRPTHLLVLLAIAAPALGGEPRVRESLQDFLARLRANRDNVQNELKTGVDALMRTMDEHALTRNIDGLEQTRGRLVALGPECAALLVDQIDPGVQGTDAQKLRSQYVTLALADLKSRAITDRLVEMAQSASPDGRLNAIQLLGLSTETERVAPVLVGLFRGNHGELRQAALISLARLGGDTNDKILDEGLTDAKPEVVDATLEALAQARKSSMGPRVLKLLANTGEAVKHQDKLLAYYHACPEAVDKATLLGIIRLTEEVSATVDSRQRVLDFLPFLADRFDPEAKKELRHLADSPQDELREGALVVLYLVGDKSARKDLLAKYDEQIDRNKDWPDSYAARAALLYRIADYREAIKDYQKAIQLAANDLRARQDTAYMGLARCYAMTNKLKEAATTIEKAPLSAKQLAALKRDPAFAKMVEMPKYKDVFTPK